MHCTLNGCLTVRWQRNAFNNECNLIFLSLSFSQFLSLSFILCVADVIALFSVWLNYICFGFHFENWCNCIHIARALHQCEWRLLHGHTRGGNIHNDDNGYGFS